MVSLHDKMVAANSRPAGFDYMRLVLASAVICNHAFIVTGTPQHAAEMWNGPDRAVMGLILPAFFVLSGFLVTGSLERNRTLLSFLLFRVIRIIPALALDVCLSALVIGPLLTTLPLKDYLHSPVFSHYFLNIIGDIHYKLPGVFTHNRYDDVVNRQLWTIPWELKCYVVLALLAAAGVISRRRPLLVAVLIAQIALVVWMAAHHAARSVAPTGETLVGCFLAGVTFFKFRSSIPSSLPLFLGSAALALLLPFVPYGYDLIFAPLVYVVTYLGTLNPPKHWVISSGDYSYGLYLYGLPLQQALNTLGPWAYNPWLDVTLVYPAAFLIAMLSWHLVEKRANRLKPTILRLESAMLRLPGVAWHSRRVLQIEREGVRPARLPPA